ncbi:lysophospholipase [Thermogutta sp.]|uniref:alpha/beta hydrolase n=1 Tax=Thermogutta sp. TaxID=1962930 RepID=UPI003C7B8495
MDTTWTTRHGTRLVGRLWEPADSSPRARIFGLHGILEHCGRYEWFAHQLTSHGYSLEMIDLRGHGRSEGPRVSVRDVDQYLEDLDDVSRQLREAGREPDFLFGHSMGAGLIILWCATRRPPVKGAILSAPPIMIAVRIPRWLIELGRFLVKVFPDIRVVQLKTARRFGQHAVSRDPAVLKALREDPLVFRGRFPLRTGLELIDLQEKLQHAATEFETPFLLLQGTGDKLSSANGATLFYERAPTVDKTLRLYEGLYHEVLSEPEKDQVIVDVLRWLDAHLAKSPQQRNPPA